MCCKDLATAQHRPEPGCPTDTGGSRHAHVESAGKRAPAHPVWRPCCMRGKHSRGTGTHGPWRGLGNPRVLGPCRLLGGLAEDANP